ncbi:MAG: PAS domain S-box protein [bacterium]|nr:PAS domain S-box protein [bacterium]
MKKRSIETKDKFIKEKKQIQNALKQAEDKYRSIVETAQEGVSIVNIDGKVTYVNKRMVEMLGYTEQEVIGVSFLKFLDEKEQTYIQENLERRKRGIRERRIFKKDGSSLWALESISPLLDANGKVNGQLIMITDITERKKAEEILRRTNNELESKTNQYTAELEEKNKQLQKEVQERYYMEKRILASNTILKLLTTSSSYGKYLNSVIKYIRNITNCKCVGIRILNEKGQIPFESYMGLSQGFWESENLLSINKDQCVCIRVITGKPKVQDIKVTSHGGSFYCNHLIKFINELSDEERAEFRNACVKHGFHSIAVIPINYKNKILGAIHIADERADMVPLKIIEIIEPLTPMIGEGVYRFSLDGRRAEVEKKLRESNAILETIFSSANFLIAYMDQYFNFIRVNQIYAQLQGYTPEFFTGKHYFDLYPGENERSIFEKVVKTGEGYSTYSKPLGSEGQPGQKITFWDWSIQPVKDSHGKVKGLVFCLIDVTERKRAEEELIKAQKREIESKRLSDIGTLAAMVAHELRNPLGVIQMAAYNIGKKSKDAFLNSHITNIEKKVSESNQIINNLLSYSRIRVPHIEKINILNLLDECVNLAGKRFFNYEVTVNRNFNLLKEEFIEADPIQMREIFINILNNAYQSLPEKKGKIEVNAARNGNDIININIKDNGCGINKEDLPKVFDTFFTKKSKGTGLGLTICKELVAMHGGDIYIESEPGEGTNININLPIRGKI